MRAVTSLTQVTACFDGLGLKWDNLAGVTTDGCPNLTGKDVRLLKQDKVILSLHCITE